MASRTVAAALCVLLLLTASAAGPAIAEQRLVNGSFEQGQAGWSGNFSVGSCAGRPGSALLGSGGFLSQSVQSVAAGTYTLRVNAAANGPAANTSMRMDISWRPESGALPLPGHTSLLSASFTTVEMQRTRPPGATWLVVTISTTGNPICIDDVVLDGPPASAFVPPTLTPIPSPTPLPPSPTPPPTATPLPAVATSTPTPLPAAPTSTRTPTPPPAASVATAVPVATSTAIAVPTAVAATATLVPAHTPVPPTPPSPSAALRQPVVDTAAPVTTPGAPPAGAALSMEPRQPAARGTPTPEAATVVVLAPGETPVAEVLSVVQRREDLPPPVVENDDNRPRLPSADVLLLGALVGLACTGGTIYLSNRWRP